MLPNEKTEKRHRLTRLDLSDLELPGQQHHRVPKQSAHDDTGTATCCQQTVVATASSVLEKDLQEKIRRTKKLIKLAQRNTERQQEMANRLVRENEARCTQLDLLPKQTVQEAQLAVACARVRQQLVDTDQAIAALHSRLEQAQAKGDVLAEQVRVAKSAALIMDQQATKSTTNMTTGMAATTPVMVATDDADDDATDDATDDDNDDTDDDTDDNESDDDDDDDGLPIPMLPVYCPSSE
jgi:hypothetical protein